MSGPIRAPIPPRPPWTRAVGRQLALWLGSIALVAVAFVAWQELRPSPEVRLVEGRAPDFALASTDGARVRLADLAGRPVVLNFWATWCGPCRAELPSLAALARRHPEVAVLGLAVDSGDARRLAAEKRLLGIPYPVLVATREVQAAYGVRSLPTTVVLDRDLRVVRAQEGLWFGWQVAWTLRRAR